LCRDIYGLTWLHAQRHLTTVCETASGPLPPAASYFHERFGGLAASAERHDPATAED
jgi:phenylacetic acid degradation operon negative regulatory protein